MKTHFRIQPHDYVDKSFEITGPGITLFVDYDDVNHEDVDSRSRLLVQILNGHWPKGLTAATEGEAGV